MSTKYIDGNYYHLYNQGVHRSAIFFSDENYCYLLRLLKKYSTLYKVSVMAYCLMPNHYHFVLRQNERGSISRFVQTTFNAYTQAINVQQKIGGTLFQGRAKSICIDSDRYVLQLIRYIHLNPVIAGLVRNPEDWLFSDYRVWIGLDVNSLTDRSFRNIYFDNGRAYRKFVEDYRNDMARSQIKKYLLDED
ncbi:MAG: transposase [Ignavibacteriae bacterium]|nr:transposase [Ignavibacteriota bacterium]